MGLHVKLSVQQGFENVCNKSCGHSMTIRRDGYVVITHAFQMHGRSSGYLGKSHGSSPNYHRRFL
nr:MAG TPA: hypothetical protein [Bacteriophage sp.]